MSNNSAGSLSVATQDQTPETSPNIPNKMALEKKKLKVLKMALKEERKSKATMEKELQSAYDRIENLKGQMNDKVRKTMVTNVNRNRDI